VLGLLPQVDYKQREVAVSDQDLLVLYSDGLAEATNTSDVEFGEDRLLATLEANWHRPIGEIQQNILDAAMRFIGTHELQDDLTLLVARVGPQPSI
jgi:sigma-B regulation protein RsbU (phosphoserine phosphatase)